MGKQSRRSKYKWKKGAACAADQGQGQIRLVADQLDAVEPYVPDTLTLGAIVLQSVFGLRFSFSSLCGVGERQRMRRAHIVFRCDPFFPQQQGEMDDEGVWHVPDLEFVEGRRPVSVHGCEDIELEWRSSAACPVCTSNDYIGVRSGECKNGMEKVAYYRANDCIEVEAAPEEEWVPCAGSWRGIIIAAITVPVGLICCCCCAYVMVLRRRYKKYMMLDEAELAGASKSGAPAVSIGASM